ncbi:hypothetical protein DERP_005847 [Dermatophagoides pteronyssinus]|uniref:Uncharacterized protein n=1 Tax=Dermatophagoides pteronyssinus TaxID=6956 RepID=A0ABQ8JAC9_DERPT|nr:hypothetical protein DERP_005847 [Dermatophagoides pteronyssinus]
MDSLPSPSSSTTTAKLSINSIFNDPLNIFLPQILSHKMNIQSAINDLKLHFDVYNNDYEDDDVMKKLNNIFFQTIII